jgi:predicted SnoaL-like aldol condensation-catalyzing enzyme
VSSLSGRRQGSLAYAPGVMADSSETFLTSASDEMRRGRMESKLETNKRLAREYYDCIINKKDFEAAKRYMGAYKQHNPLLEDGPEGIRKLIEFLKKDFPKARSEVKRAFAEGDYVFLHVHSLRQPNTRGRAIMELFRFENGKIEEHWDVIQEIPETSANPNGMF